ncbi:MAG: hypothetical protein PHV68_00980 [Candidatus Gastranaerophilales bacterium]|nr:hypothetical protein [Candidatus Gastranaerophilales bacterium]
METSDKPFVRTDSVRIESCVHCQLKCPCCANANDRLGKAIGRGALKLEDFITLIENNPTIRTVELSHFGEIFLNPALLEIMKFAYEKNVTLTAHNGINLNTVKEEVLEAMVKYKMSYVTCSIDGASDETYPIYRINGNFSTVIENIKKINNYKEKYDSQYPKLTWKFIIFGHNEHEIPLARKMATDLNMTFLPVFNFNEKYSPIKDKEYVMKEIGQQVSSRSEYHKKYKKTYNRRLCYQLWRAIQINWDGKILGCCINSWDDFGDNAFQLDSNELFYNEKISYARDMLMGKKEPRDDIPCIKCAHYKSIVENDAWITEEEIRTM